MSHYTRVNTKIKNRDVLIKALTSMGLTVQGDRVGGRTYVDASIEQNPDGTWSLNGDTWGMDVGSVTAEARAVEEELEREMRRQYALETTLENLQGQGFNLVEQQDEKDGSIRLVVRRFN